MTPDPLADLARLAGLPSLLAAARDAVDSGRRRRRLQTLSNAELSASRRTGAEASAELTGDPDSWRWGSWALALELGPLSRLILTSPMQVLARAHVLVATGRTPADGLGRLRAAPGVAERMHGLAGLLTRPTEAPGLVVAAIAHAEIATVAPFGSADDLVARAVERLVLMATGVDPEGAVPVEAGHLHLVAGYRRGLQSYVTGTPEGVQGWLTHCANALQAAAGR